MRSDLQLPETLTPGQIVTFAEELVTHRKFAAAKEAVNYTLEAVEGITIEQRLRLYAVLMQCPDGHFTKEDHRVIDQMVGGYMKGGPYDEEEEFRAYMVARYCGQLPAEAGERIADRAREVLAKEKISEEVRRYAYIFLCSYATTAEEWNKSQDALLASGDEFGVTMGIRFAAPRYQNPWDALRRLDAALKIVTHPMNHAKLMASKVRTYEKLLLRQREEYDPKVNEQRPTLLADMRLCAERVGRSAGLFREKVQCFLSTAKVALEDGKVVDARIKSRQAQELAELYGFSDLLPSIQELVESLKEE